MALGSCYTCIKYLMFAFNFLFWLLGCAILGVGIWLLVDQNVQKFVNEAESFNLFHTLAYILIAVGIIVMIIGFLGCCGAIRESPCMLGTFFACLFIIFIILLGAGIYAVVAKDTVKEATGNALERAVKNYYNEPGNQEFIDRIQKTFNCCGATKGADDYPMTGNPFPPKCDKEYIDTPCNEKFYRFIADNLVIVAGVAIGIAVVLILGMIFSMVLCCAIRDTMA